MHNVIDRTNSFYLEMSRKVLSEKEYDVLEKLLIEKMSLSEVAENYGVTSEYVNELYEITYNKVKAVTELFLEIDHYIEKTAGVKTRIESKSRSNQKRKSRKRPAETALQQPISFHQKTARCT
jgi:predicted DNA-binding protein YlxM (UPF0122 family)